MAEGSEIKFPVDGLPQGAEAQKLVGIYAQRQEGLYIQRIRVPAGRISADQWRTVAELTRDHAPGYPVHVTTRQDIQVHGLPAESIPDVQSRLAAVDLSTVAGCGDSLRNVTACPEAGLALGTVDAEPVARALVQQAEGLPWIRDMPRKFKTSISVCDLLHARPYLNCLGLIARADGGFDAVGAGSLGPRPATGIKLFEGLSPAHIVPLFIACLRLFNAEGDRERRGRARFRHIRQRWGDDRFKKELEGLFRRERREGDWPGISVHHTRTGLSWSTRLQLPQGDMAPQVAVELADLLDQTGAKLRLGLEHSVYLFADEEQDLPENLAALQHGPRIIACPGSTWCSRGISDSREAERGIRETLPDESNLLIGISGCPNNCAHAAVADIGLTGRMVRNNGEKTPGFRMVAGGDQGRGPGLASEIHPAVPAEVVPDVVADIATEYNEATDESEQFAQFATRSKERLSELVQQASLESP